MSGVTDSMNFSLIMTGVANPQAPRHSTSITVNFPSGDVTASSPASLERLLGQRTLEIALLKEKLGLTENSNGQPE